METACVLSPVRLFPPSCIVANQAPLSMEFSRQGPIGHLILLPTVDTCPVQGRIRCPMGPCLENSMDRGAWLAAVHGVSKSRTRLSDFTFTFHFHALEKEMATHSSVLAWRIPGKGEPDGLLSMGSHRVGHD